MSTVDDLRAARALIDKPRKWSSDGWGLGRKRCMLHAVADVTGARTGQIYSRPATRALRRVIGEWPGHFNDTHTHAEILAAFDQAIANELAREQEFTATPVSGVPDTVIV